MENIKKLGKKNKQRDKGRKRESHMIFGVMWWGRGSSSSTLYRGLKNTGAAGGRKTECTKSERYLVVTLQIQT